MAEIPPGMDLHTVEANLRYILNQWDPIGVAGIVQDEYDCLLAPLLTLLLQGANRAQLSQFLWSEVQDHFGLDPACHDTDRLANRLIAWWQAIRPGAQ